jgi:hypothetical protein
MLVADGGVALHPESIASADAAAATDIALFTPQTRRFLLQLTDLSLQLNHLIGIVGLLFRPGELLTQVLELLFDHFQSLF